MKPHTYIWFIIVVGFLGLIWITWPQKSINTQKLKTQGDILLNDIFEYDLYKNNFPKSLEMMYNDSEFNHSIPKNIDIDQFTYTQGIRGFTLDFVSNEHICSASYGSKGQWSCIRRDDFEM